MQATKLSDKVVLVKLTMRRAALTKRDNFLTDKVQRQEGDASLTVLTKLFRNRDSAINQILCKYNEIYAYHKKTTLPYVDAGPRLLPNELYFDYTQEMRKRIADVDSLLDTYMPMYDELVSDDVMYRNAGHMAGRANASEYPTAEQFRQATSVEMRFQPMPDARHFLFDLSEEDEATFKQAEEEALAAANADMVGRMLKPLGALVTKLSEYQGAKGERFHNSLIDNVIDGCDTALRLAINPSQELRDTVAFIKDQAQKMLTTVEVVKGSAIARANAKHELELVAKRLEGLM
jgi:hypothetical protein